MPVRSEGARDYCRIGIGMKGGQLEGFGEGWLMQRRYWAFLAGAERAHPLCVLGRQGCAQSSWLSRIWRIPTSINTA